MTADLINPAALLAAAPALQQGSGIISGTGPLSLAESGEPMTPNLPAGGFARALETVQAASTPELPGIPILDTEPALLPGLPAFANNIQPISSGTDPPLPTMSPLPMSQLLQETAGEALPEGGNDLPLPPETPVIESPLSVLPAPVTVAGVDGQNIVPATPAISPSPGNVAPALAVEPVAVRPTTTATTEGVAQPGLPNAGLTIGHEGGTSFQEGQQQAGQPSSDGQGRGHEHPLFTRDSGLAESQAARLTASGEPAPLGLASARTEASGGFAETLSELRDLTGHRTLQPLATGERFAGKLGERLVLMADNGVQSARLKLHPEHLGPLDVRIQIEDDVAQIWFGAQHGQTREALEAAMPRLREMFAEQGLELGRADVEAGHERRPGREDTEPAVGRFSSGEDADVHTSPDPARAPPLYASHRLVDVYV